MSVQEPAEQAGPTAAVPSGRTAVPNPAAGGEGAQSTPPLLPPAGRSPVPPPPAVPPRPTTPSDPTSTPLTPAPAAVPDTAPQVAFTGRPAGATALPARQLRSHPPVALSLRGSAAGDAPAGGVPPADSPGRAPSRGAVRAPSRGAVRLAGARRAPGRELATADALRIERRLRPLFQGLPPHSGIAVAVIQGEQRAVACRGYTDPAALRPVRADTRFELGSVTKTFTALLLAEMVARGEVRYDDPIEQYLPAGAVPGYPKERPITLLHLATHTSGLPRLPVGLLPSTTPHWFTRPCATFGVAHLLHSLARTPVRGTPGNQVRYSSLGCGLLGLVLENAAGLRYEDLLADRVCAPLGLLDTSCGPGGEVGSGYRRGRRVPSFRMPALPGAAALRSSADDMLRYLQALVVAGAADGLDASLRTALSEVRRPRAPWRATGGGICLGWKQQLVGAIGGEAERAEAAEEMDRQAAWELGGQATAREPSASSPEQRLRQVLLGLPQGAAASRMSGVRGRAGRAAARMPADRTGGGWRGGPRAPAARDSAAWDSAGGAVGRGRAAVPGEERVRDGRGARDDWGARDGRDGWGAAGTAGAPAALGAWDRRAEAQQVLFHEGGTRGFLAFAGFDPQAGTGLVALVSSPPAKRRRFLQAAHVTLRELAADADRQRC
ncbi:serine hydrolase [Kitasatospora sp. LaBMicrA B282]|uniref:serine hydrolase domain-containing protein n=1 Tax=Kitasatospora sp. LaBMicrA B282 TaxID=3420949 RepID=UPI003D0C0F8E